MLEQTRKSDFEAQVRTNFYVRLGDRPSLELELYQVEDGHSGPTQEQFSLFFYADGYFQSAPIGLVGVVASDQAELGG